MNLSMIRYSKSNSIYKSVFNGVCVGYRDKSGLKTFAKKWQYCNYKYIIVLLAWEWLGLDSFIIIFWFFDAITMDKNWKFNPYKHSIKGRGQSSIQDDKINTFNYIRLFTGVDWIYILIYQMCEYKFILIYALENLW